MLKSCLHRISSCVFVLSGVTFTFLLPLETAQRDAKEFLENLTIKNMLEKWPKEFINRNKCILIINKAAMTTQEPAIQNFLCCHYAYEKL